MHEDVPAHRTSRSWLIAGLIFAVVATALLVLSDDARWLRLGIVAALWAALLGGFLASHYRRQADRVSDSMEDAQAMYELELEREIAARREYELEIEADARSQAQDTARQEIDALRGEVVMLRETLQKLFGGEVLYERVALTAQSTRMRSLSDEAKPKTITAAEPRNGELPGVSRPAARPYDKLAEQRTEMIARVLDPEPSRRDLPSVANGSSRREMPAESSRLEMPEVSEPSRRRPEEQRRREPPRRRVDEPRRRAETPSWFAAEAEGSRPAAKPEPRPEPRMEPRAEPRPERKPAASRPMSPPARPPAPPGRPAASANGSAHSRYAPSGRTGGQPPSDPADSGDLSAAIPSSPLDRTPPPEVHESPRSGRRRKPDPEPTETFAPLEPPRSRHSRGDWPEPEAQSQPARRRREEPPRRQHEEPPRRQRQEPPQRREPEPWEESYLPPLPSLARMPTLEPEPEQEQQEESSGGSAGGSHASGRSVAELLAAYGSGEPPRRRRRKD